MTHYIHTDVTGQKHQTGFRYRTYGILATSLKSKMVWVRIVRKLFSYLAIQLLPQIFSCRPDNRSHIWNVLFKIFNAGYPESLIRN